MVAGSSESIFHSMVFGFYIALFWFLIRFLFYGISFPEVFIPPITFLFWWNLVFTSLWLLLILIVVIGFLGVLLRIPILGILVQGIRNQVAEIGWISFLKNRTFIWLLSQTFVLVGSFYFLHSKDNDQTILFFCLSLILLGYYLKQKFHKPLAQFSGNNRIFIYQNGMDSPNSRDNFPYEKDVTPP
ncbi:hypothetical protein EHQ96_12470 [Leptospira levettii]|uniref:Uncharacterized protein n=2 Tax=Leptospira levettii TaxID=2023178 RepID=A0ABY2MM93_9LEPT|nr:hypothetical protein CH381_10515 [Leptospira sp. mixed culture ATI2-C-A1]TGL69474.1 hypothetical protein EHQ60_11490 [Leptospira levettii]TGM25693.1 hypothetical protein EHQ74_12625 [Leptospira levettii]TGM66268.1 hypothetical protein EHQ96_12470 [Leptospira levettii]